MGTADTKLHAPTWVKFVSLILLLVAFTVATLVTIAYVGEDKADWILISISLAQIALTGIVFLLIYFFSERDHSTKNLRKLSDRFIDEDVKKSLEKIELYFCGEEKVNVSVSQECTGIFGREISIKCGEFFANLWVGINVNKIWCIYTFDDLLPDRHLNESDILKELAATIEGAKSTGYEVGVTRLASRDKGAFSLCATNLVENDPHMLTNSHRRLFFANDIAMMTHSLINTAWRAGIKHSDHFRPRPV